MPESQDLKERYPEQALHRANIDFDNTAKWAERRKLAYTTFVDLSQKEEVAELVRSELRKVNASLPQECRISKFVVLHKEFDPDEAELTRTRKLRRRYMEERYAGVSQAIYGGEEVVPVRVEVRYRDGRTGVIDTFLKVRACE